MPVDDLREKGAVTCHKTHTYYLYPKRGVSKKVAAWRRKHGHATSSKGKAIKKAWRQCSAIEHSEGKSHWKRNK